jgi:triacylglycerol lipase
MIGNDQAAVGFQREFPGKLFRYVDALDVVPKLPTVSLIANTYSHCLAEELLADAKAAGEADSVFSSLTGRASQGLLDATLMDELWSGVKSRIAHHMLTSYRARIDEKLKNLS